MLRKIRKIYWKQRDKGTEVKFLLTWTLIVLIAICGIVYAVYEYISPADSDMQATSEIKSVSGAAVEKTMSDKKTPTPSTSPTTPSATLTPSPTPSAMPVIDTSSMSSLLAFMSDSAYTELEAQLVAICQVRELSSITLLSYQPKGKTAFDIINYLLLSDGSVWKSEYSIKSDSVNLTKTDMAERDVTDLEKAALKKQKSSAKKKATAKKRVPKKKSAKKSKSKKAKK